MPLPLKFNSKANVQVLPPYTAVGLKNIRPQRTPAAISRRNGFRRLLPLSKVVGGVLCGKYYELASGVGYVVVHRGDFDGDDDGSVDFNPVRTTADALEFTNAWANDLAGFTDGGTDYLTKRGMFFQRGDYLYFCDGTKLQGWLAPTGLLTVGVTHFPGILWTGNESIHSRIAYGYYAYFLTRYNTARRVESLPCDSKSYTGYSGGIVNWFYTFQGLTPNYSGIIDFNRLGRSGTEGLYSLTGTATKPEACPAGETDDGNWRVRLYRAYVQDTQGRPTGSILNARLVAELTANPSGGIDSYVDSLGDQELGKTLTFSGSTTPMFSMVVEWRGYYYFSGISANQDRVYISDYDSPENVPVDVEIGRDTITGTAGVYVDATHITLTTVVHVQAGDWIWVKSGTNAVVGYTLIKSVNTGTNTIETYTSIYSGVGTNDVVYALFPNPWKVRPQPVDGFFAEQWVPFSPEVTGQAASPSGVVVGTRHGTYLLTGSSPTNWTAHYLTDFDCVSPETMLSTPYGVVWLSSQGLVLWTGENAPQCITESILDLDSGDLNLLRTTMKRTCAAYVRSENAYVLLIPGDGTSSDRLLWLYFSVPGVEGFTWSWDDLSECLATSEIVTCLFVANPSCYRDFLCVGTSTGRVLAEATSHLGTESWQDSDDTTNTDVAPEIKFWTGQDTVGKLKSSANLQVFTSGESATDLAITCRGVRVHSTTGGDIQVDDVAASTEYPVNHTFDEPGDFHLWTIRERSTKNKPLVITDISVTYEDVQEE